MTEFGLVVIGLFLPLFPFSMAFNAVLERVTAPAAAIGAVSGLAADRPAGPYPPKPAQFRHGCSDGHC